MEGNKRTILIRYRFFSDGKVMYCYCEDSKNITLLLKIITFYSNNSKIKGFFFPNEP